MVFGASPLNQQQPVTVMFSRFYSERETRCFVVAPPFFWPMRCMRRAVGMLTLNVVQNRML
jgi:hypothetical protein